MNLTQGDKTVDGYVAEFIRLSRFALTLVAVEEDKTNLFKDGLKAKIRKLMACQQLSTYSEVLTAARRAEIELEIDDEDEEQQKDKEQQPVKRQCEQMVREMPRLQYEEQPAKRQL